MAEANPAQGLSIGIIMDGNGRWAQRQGLPRTAGHKKGADVFEDITRYANECGVKAISYYAFSTENWARPKKELDYIMELLRASLKRLYKFRKEDKRVIFLGDRSPLNDDMRAMMDEIERDTSTRTGMTLNIAINYGGRQEIAHAARLLAGEVAAGERTVESIDIQSIEDRLYNAGQPQPDFILRTSGEQRLSNFFLWQCAYSEFIFTDTLWPEFSRADFDKAISEFESRTRRFGGL